MKVVAPRGATAQRGGLGEPARQRRLTGSVGPARMISPLGGPGSAASCALCIIATSAVPSSRSLVPGGATMDSHGPSW